MDHNGLRWRGPRRCPAASFSSGLVALLALCQRIATRFTHQGGLSGRALLVSLCVSRTGSCDRGRGGRPDPVIVGSGDPSIDP